jgi:hypothetical protein
MDFDIHEQPPSRAERKLTSLSADQTDTPYLCPDSVQGISRAVHLARLNSAWSVCDQCERRYDTEGLAEKTIQVTERIRDHRINGIRRTEFGIRGQYINELDRRTTSELARVFCLCLNQAASENDQTALREDIGRTTRKLSAGTSSDSAASDSQPALLPLSSVVAGYDGRSSSPDIFVGLTAAVRECGLPVIDIGRCTAASIQEAVRSFSNCAGALFVTGSGAPASWTGLDVSDPTGDPVPVVWKDYGVRLQHVGPASHEREWTAEERDLPSSRATAGSDGLDQLLHRLRSETHRSSTHEVTRNMSLRLLLPDAAQRHRWLRRLSRHSGTHEVLDFEARYRHWLSRWYSEKQSMRILVRSDDVLIQQRVAWLAESTDMELIARPLLDSTVIPSIQLTMTIEEDDRLFSVRNSAGKELSAERLAVLINTAVHSQFSQVTAHSDSVSGRFWMTDKGRSAKTGTTEQIRDALATLGLISRLMHLGRLTLQD